MRVQDHFLVVELILTTEDVEDRSFLSSEQCPEALRVIVGELAVAVVDVRAEREAYPADHVADHA